MWTQPRAEAGGGNNDVHGFLLMIGRLTARATILRILPHGARRGGITE
jgi:hypothetical protein